MTVRESAGRGQHLCFFPSSLFFFKGGRLSVAPIKPRKMKDAKLIFSPEFFTSRDLPRACAPCLAAGCVRLPAPPPRRTAIPVHSNRAFKAPLARERDERPRTVFCRLSRAIDRQSSTTLTTSTSCLILLLLLLPSPCRSRGSPLLSSWTHGAPPRPSASTSTPRSAPTKASTRSLRSSASGKKSQR